MHSMQITYGKLQVTYPINQFKTTYSYLGIII